MTVPVQCLVVAQSYTQQLSCHSYLNREIQPTLRQSLAASEGKA
ncbi:hypothetical protein [Trichocoleus sp. FACHB-591]|nr:hypothetical protein [Trichocoleus sp. FACHB-591]